MKKIRSIVICLHSVFMLSAQLPATQKESILTLGFWNVENLYDTLNNKESDDDEFTPEGNKQWDHAKYFSKISRLAEVLARVSEVEQGAQLAFFGLCEVENATVLADLVRAPEICEQRLDYLVGKGPDKRGINPALLYQPQLFKPVYSYDVPIRKQLDSTHPTRSILMVKGLLLDHPVLIFINHWPSRRGGELASRPNRMFASQKLQQLCDSMSQLEPDVPIFVMGDFNDDPIDESLQCFIKSSGSKNLMIESFQKGIGTLAWNDRWHLFDQVLMKCPDGADKRSWLRVQKIQIFNESYLRNQSGKFRGYPWRTFNGSRYSAGYSDHFPVCVVIRIVKE